MKKYKVLVVDDEIPFLKYLEDFSWEESGFELLGKSYNGKEALNFCVKNKPDIIITDINMPVMDGIELMRRVKSAYPEIQIILLTVIESFEYVKESISNGAVDYIVKSAENYDLVERALGKAKKSIEININNSLMIGKKMVLDQSIMIANAMNDNTAEEYYDNVTSLLCENSGVLVTIQFEYGNILNEITSEAVENYIIKKFIDKLFFIKLTSATYQFILPVSVLIPDEWIELFVNEIETEFKDDGLKIFAVAGDYVHNVHEYIALYYIHKTILKQSFYCEQSQVFNKDTPIFRKITQIECNKWIHSLKKVITDYDKTVIFIKQFFLARAIKDAYEPEDVRKLFIEFISQNKKKYADMDDVNFEMEILSMENIFSIVQLFLNFVKKLVNTTPGISYEINRVIKYIEQNLGNSFLQLSDVSDHVHISQGYLSRALKEITGETFKQMLFRLRMENAAFLLKNSDKKIYEVAEASGYSNYRSFIKVFKEHYNVTPKKFRSI